jgi:hypothetical protein
VKTRPHIRLFFPQPPQSSALAKMRPTIAGVMVFGDVRSLSPANVEGMISDIELSRHASTLLFDGKIVWSGLAKIVYRRGKPVKKFCENRLPVT